MYNCTYITSVVLCVRLTVETTQIKVTSHNMDVELSDTLNKSWKENKSNFGYRMLAKMGWSEDKGKSGVVCVCVCVCMLRKHNVPLCVNSHRTW